MGKTKKPPGPSVDELIIRALVTIATAEGTVRLSGKGDHSPVFTSTAGGAREAIARLKDDDPPLAKITGKGKTESVHLTAAGFQHALPHIPAEKVGPVAKSLAAELPAAAAVEFLNGVVRRTPDAAPELLPILEEALAAEKAEADARAAEAARRRETEEASRKAIAQWLTLLEQRQQQRIDALTRELLAEGGKVPELVPAVRVPVPESLRPPALRPETAEDATFRRQVARRLVSPWLEAVDGHKEEARRYLETAIWNITGFRKIGEAGERVTFDGARHEGPAGLFTGDQVRVVRPGWALEENDGEYLVLKAQVAK
ncbi:MAG TPA: hypothetical protein VKE74_13640 [Gemmataceae bacterium]|nr:hypothetical protein [Gemmataceae bacterium]